MKNSPSIMNQPASVDNNVNQSELYKDLVGKMAKLNNFDNDVVGGMEVINAMPKIRAMIVPGKHADLGPVIEAAKELIKANLEKLSNKDEVKDSRLDAIKAKLEALNNYEQNPALGIQTLKSMPIYAEKMATGKGLNMNAIIQDAIESTQRIVTQLERTKKN